MKRIKNYLTILLGVVLLASCEPAEIPEIGTPRNVLSDMTGSYTLTKATQIDDGAIKKGFPYKSLDVTKFYTGMELTFNSGTYNNVIVPGTFSITPGDSGNSLSTINSGRWAVDDDTAPKVVTFISGNNRAKVNLGDYTLLDYNKLLLKVSRKQGLNTVMTYEFEFAKN